MALNREYGNRVHKVLGAAFAQRRKEWRAEVGSLKEGFP